MGTRETATPTHGVCALGAKIAGSFSLTCSIRQVMFTFCSFWSDGTSAPGLDGFAAKAGWTKNVYFCFGNFIN
jgi:hypothetical protein